MKMKKIIFGLILASILTSCEKQEGRGGNSAIYGQVYQNVYDNSGSFVVKEEAREVNVYLIYGETGVYDDNMDTHYDGSYEFRYLHPGKYKVFAYSDCDSCPSNTVAVEVSVEITGKNETVVSPDIIVDNR
jgi:hypothetical protein